MNKNEKIEILSSLIEIDSVNSNESKVADYISSLFEKYKNQVNIERVEYSPGRDNLVITIGKSDKILGFTGHEDVVSPGDLSAWDINPFKPEIKKGKLYGRGATDMKGGLAALIITMLEFLESDEIPGCIKLLATVGEETGEYGAAQLTKSGYADGLSGLVIAEPGNEMKEVGISSKGVIDYTITSVGKSAHSSTPEKGINAIDNILDFANEVRPLLNEFNKVDPVLGKLTHVQSVISGGDQVNSVPSKAIMSGNIRTIPAYPNKKVFSALDSLVEQLNTKKGYDLSIQYSFPEEAMAGKPDSHLVKLIRHVHDEMYTTPIKVVGKTGASDGSEFLHAKGEFDIVQIGPGNNTGHQSNENIDVNVFLKSIKFYKKLAVNFFK
ncbi:ArgE/DapE family deacylase [Ligilactobacillus pobuzihii]|uniref:ArgE/DapE family deacylase n=1 Tax=Ligilactobacillus pobuzihii TaxID=449659 RepID=UPI0019D30980|nr:ArgE/DapE family deacylase [Ligilactobacillus pobuzihii]MBN7274753.1 ArgE/DapE family deacylase [Ligilactobacillus pobuzihii]